MYWLCAIQIFISVTFAHNFCVIVYSAQSPRELACFFQLLCSASESLHKCVNDLLCPTPHTHITTANSTSCLPVRSLMSSVQRHCRIPPPFPAIDASLQDVEVEFLEPIEIPNFRFIIIASNYFSIDISSMTVSFVFFSVLLMRILHTVASCSEIDQFVYVRHFPSKGFASIQLQR